MSAEDLHLVPTYQKFPLKIVRGAGATLLDDQGKEYIDLSGGYGVAIVGHANSHVANAIARQASKLITCHASLYNDAREDYLKKLAAVLPSSLSRLFLCNSGAEANEAAIKFARVFTGKSEVVAFTGSFHGKTLGALSATWNPKYRKLLDERLFGGVAFAPYGNLEKAKELVSDKTAAVIVEPVQGESGVHIASSDFLEGLRTITSEKRAVLIFDEVQCGFGRTGRMWGFEHCKVEPDVLTSAKGIGGGFPLGFTAVTESISSALKPGAHTSTFGGNPLGCAAGLAALEFLIKEKLIEKADINGAYFLAHLALVAKRHPRLVRDVRGKGLMIAMEFKIPIREIVTAGFGKGLILLYSGLNILRFLPPLVITRQQIDLVCSRLDSILSEVESSRTTAVQGSPEQILNAE